MPQNDRKRHNLSPMQLRMIDALMTSKSRREACLRTGTAPRTLYRWLELPAFKQELYRRTDELAECASRELQRSLMQSIKVLNSITMNTESQDAVRVNAARIILENNLRYTEQVEILKRLEQLENDTQMEE